MIINKSKIPDKHVYRTMYKDYLKHYGDKDFSIEEFVTLGKIPFGDKVEILTLAMNQDQRVETICRSCETILRIYGVLYPPCEVVRNAMSYVIGVIKSPRKYTPEDIFSAAQDAYGFSHTLYHKQRSHSSIVKCIADITGKVGYVARTIVEADCASQNVSRSTNNSRDTDATKQSAVNAVTAFQYEDAASKIDANIQAYVGVAGVVSQAYVTFSSHLAAKYARASGEIIYLDGEYKENEVATEYLQSIAKILEEELTHENRNKSTTS